MCEVPNAMNRIEDRGPEEVETNNTRQPGQTGKITKEVFDFYVAGFEIETSTCPACKSTDTEAQSELTHVCLECENVFHLDNLPPTPEDEALEDAMNMYCLEDF